MSQPVKEFHVVIYQGQDQEEVYQGHSFKKADRHLTKGLKQNQPVTWVTYIKNDPDSTIKTEYFKPTEDTENPKISSDTISVPNSCLERILKKK